MCSSLFATWGYLEADLDPLAFLPPVSHPSLRIEGELADEARARATAAPWARSSCTSPTPSGAAGSRNAWKGPQPAVDQERVLDLLIRADLFEQVLQQRYLGTKRFSLEGVTALIPLVDEILRRGRRSAAP